MKLEVLCRSRKPESWVAANWTSLHLGMSRSFIAVPKKRARLPSGGTILWPDDTNESRRNQTATAAMKTTVFLTIWVLLTATPVFAQREAEKSPSRSEEQIAICASQTAPSEVVPIPGYVARAILHTAAGRNIIIEPSLPILDPAHAYDAKFDYRVSADLGAPRVWKISELGKTPDESEELAYRRLDSVGISCLPQNDILIYASFTVNGSARDYFYVGLQITNATVRFAALGRSDYGVLAIDPADPFRFAIWDSSPRTRGNGMGSKHAYVVSFYQWSLGGQSAKLIRQGYSKPFYPGQILGEGEDGIKVGHLSKP